MIKSYWIILAFVGYAIYNAVLFIAITRLGWWLEKRTREFRKAKNGK